MIQNTIYEYSPLQLSMLATPLQNDLFDTAEFDQDIEAGHQAANTVCQYVDWLLSTVNPNPPDDGNCIRPEIHPCQRQHSDICDHDIQSDYVDLLNMVQYR